MASNPFKPLNKFPKDELESPRSAAIPTSAQIPGITRPERPLNTEFRRERFKRLAGMIRKPTI
jgi:hypothetical protein